MITHFDATDTNHLILQTLRLPRALTAALVGASMGAVLMILVWPNAGSGALPLAAMVGGAWWRW